MLLTLINCLSMKLKIKFVINYLFAIINLEIVFLPEHCRK